MKKNLKIAIVLILLAAVGLYFYLYKGHRNISSEEASYAVSVDNLQKEFSENDSIANLKYLDNTIEVYGKISGLDVSSNAIIIDDKVFATAKDLNIKKLTIGKNIKVKGRFIGYDDLLENYKLDQIIIID
jgi:predicted negative regulator of RcsB-dependent stress response